MSVTRERRWLVSVRSPMSGKIIVMGGPWMVIKGYFDDEAEAQRFADAKGEGAWPRPCEPHRVVNCFCLLIGSGGRPLDPEPA